LDIKLGPHSLLRQVHSFKLWLPQYSGLVRSLTIKAWQQLPFMITEKEAAIDHDICCMLQTAMQQAPAAAAAVGKSAAYAAAAEAQQQQQKQVLRLAQFSSDAPYAASLLGYLPGSQPNSTRCQHGIQ
jgi:hypothetical protein